MVLTSLIILLILIIFNGIFSALEFSLMTSKKDKLQVLQENGNKRASKVLKALEKLTVYLTTAQCGITICSILIGYFGEPAMKSIFGKILNLLPLNISVYTVIETVLATVIIVFLHMVFGEMVPKNIAISQPESTATSVISFGNFFLRIFKPLIFIFNKISNLFLYILRIPRQKELSNKISELELLEMLGDSHSYGYIDQIELDRITRTVTFNKQVIKDSLIKFDEIKCIYISKNKVSVKLSTIKNLIAETGFSRFPVASHSKELLGYVHAKDFISYLDKDDDTDVTKVITKNLHKLPILSEGSTVTYAIDFMREEKSHLVQVIDNTNTTIGIVTLEDLVEELVGTVNDKTHR